MRNLHTAGATGHPSIWFCSHPYRNNSPAGRNRQGERRTRAQLWAREVAEILGEADPTLKRVIGFGSTFELWRTYREDSDIDLGIIGGNWSFLMRSIPSSEFDVSLVELELQNPEFRDYVLVYGEVLYENS